MCDDVTGAGSARTVSQMRTLRQIVAPLAIAAVLISCGGSDGESAADDAADIAAQVDPHDAQVDPDAGAAEVDPDADAAQVDPDADAAQVDPDAGESQDATESSADGETSEVCGAIQSVADAFAAGDSADTQEGAIAAIENFALALADFAEVAPDEIKTEADLLAEGTQLIANADLDNITEEDLAVLDDPSYDAAGETLEDYARTNCDIEIAAGL